MRQSTAVTISPTTQDAVLVGTGSTVLSPLADTIQKEMQGRYGIQFTNTQAVESAENIASFVSSLLQIAKN